MGSEMCIRDSIFSIFGDIASAVAVKTIMSSDVRLKDDIELLHTLPNGIKVYTWQWNETAQDLGLATSAPVGVLAQELQKTHPEAVLEGSDGYLRVNYGAIV